MYKSIIENNFLYKSIIENVTQNMITSAKSTDWPNFDIYHRLLNEKSEVKTVLFA
jgi:hypothetical protein